MVKVSYKVCQSVFIILIRNFRKEENKMGYTWSGMKKISFEEVMQRHKQDELVGCFKLYDDESESQIEEGYNLQEIINHYEFGGEFGIEL